MLKSRQKLPKSLFTGIKYGCSPLNTGVSSYRINSKYGTP